MRGSFFDIHQCISKKITKISKKVLNPKKNVKQIESDELIERWKFEKILKKVESVANFVKETAVNNRNPCKL